MFIVWRHHSPGANTSDVHSVRWLRTRPARAILGMDQSHGLIQVIEDQDPPATAGAPDSEDEVTFPTGKPTPSKGSGVFRV